nr:hypothetical protein [Agrobacterium salinitolerans]
MLFSTGIEAGYALLDDSNGWGRINLVAAAGGYGAFDGDVEVTMDAAGGSMRRTDGRTILPGQGVSSNPAAER